MRALFAVLFVVLLASCVRSAPAPDFGCPLVAGEEAMAARRYILIDGGPEAAAAAAALACRAAGRGRVIVAAGPEAARALAGRLAPISARGGAVRVFTLDAPPQQASGQTREERDRLAGEARNEAFARAAADARDAADTIILVLAAPDGARDAVGLSGHTWRPLGARMAQSETYCLRVESAVRPGLRVRLTPFEDVPTRGAAIRYDGLIEVGPAAQ